MLSLRYTGRKICKGLSSKNFKDNVLRNNNNNSFLRLLTLAPSSSVHLKGNRCIQRRYNARHVVTVLHNLAQQPVATVALRHRFPVRNLLTVRPPSSLLLLLLLRLLLFLLRLFLLLVRRFHLRTARLQQQQKTTMTTTRQNGCKKIAVNKDECKFGIKREKYSARERERESRTNENKRMM